MRAALLRLLGGERREGGFGEPQVSVDGNRVTVFNGMAPAMGWRGGTGGRVEGSLLLILAPSLLPDAPARHPLAEPFPDPFPSMCHNQLSPAQGSKSGAGSQVCATCL